MIHLIFVPTIWTTVAVWFCYTGPLVDYTLDDLIGAEKLSVLPSFVSQNCVPNAALFFFLAYALFYIFLDLTGGVRICFCRRYTTYLILQIFASIVLFACFLAANMFYTHVGREMAWIYSLVVHVFGWYMQIHPGHAILEKRKPALLDSFFQSLFMAPLFVCFEVVFFLGLRPKLYKQLQTRVNLNILKYRGQLRRKEA